MAYRKEKFALIFVVIFPFLAYYLGEKLNRFSKFKKKDEYFRTQLNYIVTKKSIDSTFNARMAKFILMYDSVSHRSFILRESTFEMYIDSIWENVKLGDRIIKKRNTLFLIIENEYSRDTFWYKNYYEK